MNTNSAASYRLSAVIESVKELESSVFPSLHHRKEGWPSD